jgi:dTDP-D-glucose 4,6-dehydratase
MATLQFADLGLTNKAPQPKTIKYNETEIQVRQWLPIADKAAIIEVTLQEAREGNIYSPLKLEMYFVLNMVYKYSDILFSQEDRDNADETFDKLNTSGLMSAILEAIPQTEKDYIYNFIIETKEVKERNNGSFLGALQSIIEVWPEATEKAMEALKDFDVNKYVEAQRFAQATNGGNPIPAGQN